MNIRKFRRAAVWSSAAIAVIAAAGVFVVVSALDDDAPPRWLAKMGFYESLRNSGENVQTSRSVIIDSPERYVFVRVTGNFSLAPETLADGEKGVAIIAETRGGMTRSVRYERQANHEIRRVYKIDGRIHELDADGVRWVEEMLPIASL